MVSSAGGRREYVEGKLQVDQVSDGTARYKVYHGGREADRE